MSEIRVRWSVMFMGPRAADDPKHSIGGSGETPKEALDNALANIEKHKELGARFRDAAIRESDDGWPEPAPLPPDYWETAE